jgi:hypothetical protein
VQIRSLEEIHSGMNSLLHTGVREQGPDLSAFIYSMLRLPDCLCNVRLVVLGQSKRVFSRKGYGNIEHWVPVVASARRRRCYFDGESVMACIIASRSDIDDIVPMMTAYQIEWNKMHRLLQPVKGIIKTRVTEDCPDILSVVGEALKLSADDIERLQTIWGDKFFDKIERIVEHPLNLRIQLLSGSLSDYRRATNDWWEHISEIHPEVLERPLYFISSNMHSIVNLVSGFALAHRPILLNYLEKSEGTKLLDEWDDIQKSIVPSSQENFLYYVLKKYLQTDEGYGFQGIRREHEHACGVERIDSEHFFDVDTQVIDLSQLRPDWMDPRLCEKGFDFLEHSDALILNIDYPLGLAAYNILSKISEHSNKILGVYILGKAATLNGVIGDVMIPNVVHDEHSRNSYIFPNVFEAADVASYLVYGTVLDNQKAVTVRGTFLQNSTYMDVFYREGYTDIEMEAGPYLSAVYEMFRPKRHPWDEIVNLYHLPFDLGIMHYASDTPLSKGKNLGALTLSYFGMDPTYATSIAVLKRILLIERQRVGKNLPKE